MLVQIVTFDQLPTWVDRDSLPDNSSGKEYANYLIIEDGHYRSCQSDAMEPEDCRFTRDLSWIKDEILRAGGHRP